MKKNKIIITGGAGFVGTNLINLFLKRTKFKIFSIDNYSSGSKKNHIKNKRVRYINGDTKDISKILNKPKSINSIFHFGEFARIYQSFIKMNDCINSNSIGSNEVFNYCLKNKIKLIYSATSASLGNKGRDKNLILKNALELQEICTNHQALFIVNDYADIANLSNATGLHIGQSDLPIESSRLIINENQIIGKSNNTIEQAISSQSEAPDYLAIGPIYPTSTMGKGGKQSVGTETIREIKSRGIPVLVCIGGINIDNAASVYDAGADSICVASAVTLAKNPEIATRKLVDIFQSK